MASVDFRGIAKRYDRGPTVLEQFDLAVQDGELMVIVGPSGCGKSTTLRLIAGLERPTEGTIELGGTVINDVPPRDRDVAMVFQSYALYPHMTVEENMGFSLRLRGSGARDIKRRVREVAEALGLEAYLTRRPRELSGGQRQRVAVGRAIVRQPQAFLFDEPLSNLDAALRVETRAEIKRLHRRLETTTLYVTHDQEEALTLADRIVVLKDGRAQQCGTPSDVYQRPANRFVAGFIGSPAMSFLEGTLTSSDGRVFLEEHHGLGLPLPTGITRSMPRAGTRVVLGCRPQAWRLAREGDGSGMELRVDWVESIGDSVDLHLLTPGDQRVLARVSGPVAIEPNSVQRLCLDPTRVCFFEADGSERRIDAA